MNYHSNHIRFAKGYTVANVRLPCIYCKGHVHPEITFETKNSEGELKSVGHLDSASNSG